MPKSKAAILVLNTLAEVQEAVRRIAAAITRRTALGAEKDEKIAKVRETYADALADYDKEIKSGRPPIERWALRNLDLFAGRRSLELTHGTIGFRLHPPTVVNLRDGEQASDFSHALDALQSAPKAARDRFLRVKVEPDLNAIREEILAGGPQADFLKAIGLGLAQDEQFYIEPKADSAPPAP